MSLVIAKISGIPIRLHYTWFVVFILITWSVGFGLMPQQYPGLDQTIYIIIGILSALLLFGSIILHELSHSIVAQRGGLKINQITLFIFGGIAEMGGEAKDPILELRMAAAGPATSVVIALVAGLGWQISIFAQASVLVQAPLQYASLVNGAVALFNLVPAFPLDGGRMLRSILWKRRGDLLSATRTASRVGTGFGYSLMIIGALMMFNLSVITGLWLILIGWFILSAARGGLEQTILGEALSGYKVSEIMTGEVEVVDPETKGDQLADNFLMSKHSGFPVLRNGDLIGCVSLTDLRKIPREKWSMTKVRDIMTPSERLFTIQPDEAATQAMTQMGANKIGRLPVLEDGKLVGIITRSDIMSVVNVKRLA